MEDIVGHLFCSFLSPSLLRSKNLTSKHFHIPLWSIEIENHRSNTPCQGHHFLPYGQPQVDILLVVAIQILIDAVLFHHEHFAAHPQQRVEFVRGRFLEVATYYIYCQSSFHIPKACFLVETGGLKLLNVRTCIYNWFIIERR